MAKKSAKKKSQQGARPETAQIKAIERLIDGGRLDEALKRVGALVQRFRDHGGLRRLLIGALEQARGKNAATLAAFEWAEQRPNSLSAQQTLFNFALAGYHALLADRTARRIQALGGDTRGFPLDPADMAPLLEQPDGSLGGVEDMERFDIGKLHLDAQDFRGAARWLDGMPLLSARNNRALALFHLQRIDEALDAFLSSWQADADNLFALGWVIRLRLYRGDETEELAARLAAAKARRLDDAIAQIDALLLLRQDQAALDAYEAAIHADWMESATVSSGAMLHHFGACAAARLRRSDDAEDLWEAALDQDSDFAPANANLLRIQRGGDAPHYPEVDEIAQTLPLSWTKAMRDRTIDTEAGADALGASNDYLEALYLGTEETVRRLVRILLRRRVTQGDRDAASLLRRFARLPIGSDDDRFELLRFLKDQGLLAHGELVDYWAGDALQQVRIIATEIHREPRHSELPPDLDALLSEAVLLYNARLPEQASTMLEEILERVPDHPTALGNLAAIRSMLGHHEEAVALLRQAIEQDPDYLFARCNLAQMMILDGDIGEAERLLAGLAERDRLHVQDAIALYGCQAMLDRARGRHDEARSRIANLELLVETEDDARRVAQAKRLADRVDPVATFLETTKALADSVRDPGRRRT